MTNDMRYTWYQHKGSGEIYAVEFDHADKDNFTRVAGPLHHSEPRDPASIRYYLDNQDDEACRDDAAWLADEVASHAG